MRKFIAYLSLVLLTTAFSWMMWFVISDTRLAREVKDSRVLVTRMRGLVAQRCKFSGILDGKVNVNCNRDGSYTITRNRFNKFMIVVIQKESPTNMLGFSSSPVILTGDDPVYTFTTTDGEKIECKNCEGPEHKIRNDFNRFVMSLNEDLSLATD